MPCDGYMDADTPVAETRPPLSPLAGRVLGCLVEKERTTPEVYPLTLNALVNACNQKSNRQPVMAVGPVEVEAAIGELRRAHLAERFDGAESRVPKYRHRLGSRWNLPVAVQVLLAELLLRGPQTAAELRARASRMAPLADAAQVEEELAAAADPDGALLAHRLARQPGRKEARWQQALAVEPETTQAAAEPVRVALELPPEVEQRLAALESEVATLRESLERLRASLGEA